MTIEEIMRLAAQRGPWKFYADGCIRNWNFECPVHAAAIAKGVDRTKVFGAYTAGEHYLNLPGFTIDKIVAAADDHGTQQGIRQLMIDILKPNGEI